VRRNVLLAGALLSVACGPLPNGSSGIYMTGLRPAVLYNLTSDGDGGLLHILALQPHGSSLGSNGGGFQLDWTSASEETIWRDGDSERRFSFAYRLFPRRLEIDGETWSLERSNVFVVRLDDQHPTVEPLALQSSSASSVEVLRKIQAALPHDPEIASLKVVH
jgi:hypothetical protein